LILKASFKKRLRQYFRRVVSYSSRKKAGLLLVAVATCTLLLFAGVSLLKAIKAEPQVYTMVGLFHLSSPFSDQSACSVEAALLAQSEINAWLEANERQWRLALEFEDTWTDSAVLLKQMENYLEEGITFFIGPSSSYAAEKSLPFANENQLLMVSPAADSCNLAFLDDWLFRFSAEDYFQGRAIAAAAAAAEVEYLIIGWQNDSYGESIRAEIESIAEQYGIIVYEDAVAFEPGQLAFTAELNALRKNVDSLLKKDVQPHKIGFCLIAQQESFNFLNAALRHSDLQNIIWIGTESLVTGDRTVVRPVDGPTAGTVRLISVKSHSDDSPGNPKREMVREYLLNRLEKEPEQYAFNTYNIVWSLALSIDEAGYDSLAVKNILPRVAGQWSEQNAAGGHLVFNEYGDRAFADYEIYLFNDEAEWELIGLFSHQESNSVWSRYPDWPVAGDVEQPVEKDYTFIEVPEDYSTIQEALNKVEEGGIIIVSPGIYKETVDFLGKNVTLQSIDPEDRDIVSKTIIDGDGQSPVVSFRGNEKRKAKITGFTITGGQSANDGGGILIENSSPTISGNLILDNHTKGRGGGIYIYSWSSPLIINNIISANNAENGGAGIALEHSLPTIIEDNHFEDNYSPFGGAVFVGAYCNPNLAERDSNSYANNLSGDIFYDVDRGRPAAIDLRGLNSYDQVSEVLGEPLEKDERSPSAMDVYYDGVTFRMANYGSQEEPLWWVVGYEVTSSQYTYGHKILAGDPAAAVVNYHDYDDGLNFSATGRSLSLYNRQFEDPYNYGSTMFETGTVTFDVGSGEPRSIAYSYGVYASCGFQKTTYNVQDFRVSGIESWWGGAWDY